MPTFFLHNKSVLDRVSNLVYYILCSTQSQDKASLWSISIITKTFHEVTLFLSWCSSHSPKAMHYHFNRYDSYVTLTSNLPTLTSLIGVSVNKLNHEAEALFSNIFNCVKMGSAIFQSSNIRNDIWKHHVLLNMFEYSIWEYLNFEFQYSLRFASNFEFKSTESTWHE